MASNSGTFFGSADFERGKHGWAKVSQEDGATELYKRVTTVAGYLDDRGGLIEWKSAKVARGVALSDSLRANFSLLSWESDKNNIKPMLAKAATIGGADEAAEMGTAFHSLIDQLHMGKTIDKEILPDGFHESMQAYQDALRSLGGTVKASEIRVVDDEHKVAGTADIVISFQEDVETPFGTIPAGKGIIADIKTGSVADYSGLKMSMQLGIYSHATPYNPLDGTRGEWPLEMFTSIGLVLKVDIPNRSVEMWWLDLDTAYDLVPLALQINETRYIGKKLIQRGHLNSVQGAKEAKAEPEITVREIGKLVTSATDADTLTDIKADHGDRFTEAISERWNKKMAELSPEEDDDLSLDDDEPEAPKVEEKPAPEPESDDDDDMPFDDAPDDSAGDTIEGQIEKESAEASNIGQLKELVRKWRRAGATADQIKIITNRAAELGATVRKG